MEREGGGGRERGREGGGREGGKEREREEGERIILFSVFFRFPLVLEQLLVFELVMSLELVTLRKLNEQPLRHSWSKVQQRFLKVVAIVSPRFVIICRCHCSGVVGCPC